MKLTVRVVFSEYTSILLLHKIVHVFLPLRFNRVTFTCRNAMREIVLSIKVNMYTFRGSNSFIFILPQTSIGVNS